MSTDLYIESWQESAACRGPRSVLFFPPTHFERKDEKLAREQEAKAICGNCDVKVQCLQYAIRVRESHGVWGGLNESERKRMTGAQPLFDLELIAQSGGLIS